MKRANRKELMDEVVLNFDFFRTLGVGDHLLMKNKKKRPMEMQITKYAII